MTTKRSTSMHYLFLWVELYFAYKPYLIIRVFCKTNFSKLSSSIFLLNICYSYWASLSSKHMHDFNVLCQIKTEFSNNTIYSSRRYSLFISHVNQYFIFFDFVFKCLKDNCLYHPSTSWNQAWIKHQPVHALN
jgi:hypothetical protein